MEPQSKIFIPERYRDAIESWHQNEAQINTRLTEYTTMLKLTYFPIPGRAYIARTCFGYGGVEFVDERIGKEQFVALKGDAGSSDACPMGSLPVLTLPSGRVVCESGAINRYAAKRAGLYPEDPEKALLVDEVLLIAESVMGKVPYDKDPETRKEHRALFAQGFLKRALILYATRLAPGPFVLGTEFSVADLTIYSLIKTLRSGFLDDVPTDIDSAWPVFQGLIDRVEAIEKMAPYKIKKSNIKDSSTQNKQRRSGAHSYDHSTRASPTRQIGVKKLY